MASSPISLKQTLASKKPTIGSWITLAHPAIAEIMAAAGFEWLVVDLEHSVISMREAGELIRVIGLSGAAPLVRLSSNDPVQTKRVMDAGAHGVIVPMVCDADQARRAVQAVRYPPQGQRGVGLARAQGYGSRFNEYLDWCQKEAVVIVQIEHIDGVENLESILAVEGVDGLLVGPYDLSGSLSLPGQFDHPKVVQALKRVGEVAAAMGKPAGIHVVEPDPKAALEMISQGYSIIAFGVDIRILDATCRSTMKELAAGLSRG